MTTGEKLKKNLGLEKLKYVKISRAVLSSYRILFVWYDSYRPTMPITNHRIKKFPWIAHIFHGTDLYHNTNKITVFTPAINIEDYNGAIRGSLIIPVNLAGDRFINKKQFTKIFESKLNEKFVDYIKSVFNNKEYTIYVNPTAKEVKEIHKEDPDNPGMRGIFLSNINKVFVANSNLLHKSIKNYLEKLYSPLNLNEYGLYFTTDSRIETIIIECISDDAFKEFVSSDFYNKFLLNYEIELKEVLLEKQSILLGERALKEFVTLNDLKSVDTISNFTQVWRKDRNRVMGAENITAKLIDCVIDEADRSVTFQFLTEATELGNDPETFKIKRNRSRTYEIQIKILEFFDWLDAFEGEKIGRKEINEILEVSNVQIFSTSPSFHWQGMNYNLSQIDASIYPTDIPNSVWGPRHGDPSGYFLDKHTYGLLRQISFFAQQMGSMLTGKLQRRGLI